MKILIEDYKRRLQAVNTILEKGKNSGSVADIEKFQRLNTKASEYRTFIVELERCETSENSKTNIEKKKEIVTETIFNKIDYAKPIPFKDINIELKPDDIIKSGWNEGFYSENESQDAHFYLEVEREREETDKEYQERLKDDNFISKEMKKRRFQNYIKLKKEFEGNDDYINIIGKEKPQTPTKKQCEKLNKMDIEPIPMKAGDKRVLVNGRTLGADFRIISEENYLKLKEKSL
jgi:hypothetical protein